MHLRLIDRERARALRNAVSGLGWRLTGTEMVGQAAEREGIGGESGRERGFLLVMWPPPICQSQAKHCLTQAQPQIKDKDSSTDERDVIDAMRCDARNSGEETRALRSQRARHPSESVST